MIKKMRQWKGQSTLEYAVLVVIIIAALLSLQTYIKRGVQGRLRKSTDDIGDQFSTSDGSKWTKTTKSYSKTNETVLQGLTTSKGIGAATTNTTENVTLGNTSGEF